MVRKRGMRRVRAIVFTLTAVLAIAAAPSVRAENVLRWASTTQTLTFDPHAVNHIPTIAENHQVYEPLVDINVRYELEPALATAWRLLDPLTWEFELRRGVAFHGGEPFTAEDVVFSLRRLPPAPRNSRTTCGRSRPSRRPATTPCGSG